MEEILNAVCSQLLQKEDLHIEKEILDLFNTQKIITRFYFHNKQKPALKIFSQTPIYLSTLAPLLHDFNFTIIDEVPYEIQHPSDNSTIYIIRFNLLLEDSEPLKRSKANVITAITHALEQEKPIHCRLYVLIYKQNFTLREILLIESFIEYLKQAYPAFNHDTIQTTLIHYNTITATFIALFYARFEPKLKQRDSKVKTLSASLQEQIKAVPNIHEDRILKALFTLILSLVRTNFYLQRESIALKVATHQMHELLTGIQPYIETFVYSHHLSGVHLRMSLVARGGLRWSERYEDYRNEVKSLMITQQGKNAIIIPDGAKGGFIIKSSNLPSKEEFSRYYTLFIENLLDVVDNREDDTIVRNEQIVAYDEEDSYFVVAADKGTASMSDVANAIATKRNFWLGDAFASGGSNGFGHKKLGITAKGALKSSERFFIEKGINIQTQSITVVGIGSMNGDVFGNGMLYSKAFKLIAAISHKEIFIDPDPIPAVAFEERQRLFLVDNGSWSNYNPSLISKGGGVFLRSEKSITLSPEIQKLIHSTKESLSAEALAKRLLCLKVDLLFNGGVGTYVKSSEESNFDLGDKQNESVRVDANMLKAFAVCEGGNLGFTQAARIEYALSGGHIHLDSIDNAAGVNTSDHEVNLKILLQHLSKKGVLTNDEANQHLEALTEQVSNMVLWNNYWQALAISQDQQKSAKQRDAFLQTIALLEQEISSFKRHDFYIPKDENIHEIINNDGEFIRPILGSLISYAKIFLKQVMLRNGITQESFAKNYLFKYFPKSFVSAFENEILQHPLRKEIIATVIADTIINLQGITFISDYLELGIERFELKIRAYLLSNQLFNANDIRYEIFRNDFTIEAKKQYALLNEIERAITFSSSWMAKYMRQSQFDSTHILDYQSRVFTTIKTISTTTSEPILKDNDTFNQYFCQLDYLRFAIAAIMVKEQRSESFEEVATIFYLVIETFKIVEMINSLDNFTPSNGDEALLHVQLQQFIEFSVVQFTQKILSFKRIDESADDAFKNYLHNDEHNFTALFALLSRYDAQEEGIHTLTVLINQLLNAAL